MIKMIKIIKILDGPEEYYGAYNSIIDSFILPLEKNWNDLKKELKNYEQRLKEKGHGDTLEIYPDDIDAEMSLEEAEERNIESDFPIELNKLHKGFNQ